MDESEKGTSRGRHFLFGKEKGRAISVQMSDDGGPRGYRSEISGKGKGEGAVAIINRELEVNKCGWK